MSFDLKFRQHILKIREKESLTFSETADRFGISRQTVYNWSKRLEPKLTRNKPATKINMEALVEDVEKYPDAYHYERAFRLKVSTSGVRFALQRLGVTYKKNSKSPQGVPRKTTCLPGKS